VVDTKKPLRNILIIDDDDDFRKLMLSWLTSQFQDIEVVEYDPLSQGVPYKNLDWSTFDVLLLDYDLQLGGVTGLDILQDCYDNLLFPTTIMLTGAGNEETKVRALQLGVADYLRKEQLTKEEIKAAMDNAFAQQCSKRKHLYILNDAMQVAQSESKKIIEVYKTQYDQEREQEVKSLKAELEKSQEELIKSQEMLATFEEDHKNAEVEKSKLLAEIHKLKVQQSNATEEVDIETKLESTQDGLMRVNTSIKKVKQSIDNAKAAVEKTRWKQNKEAAEQQEVENDLAIALQDKKQSSDARDEMRQRLEMFISDDTKEINSEENNQTLFDDISTQLDTKNE
jgi:DNA-binding response OmpR family regulator